MIRKKIKLGWLKRLALSMGFSAARKAISEIHTVGVRKMALIGLDFTEDVVDALTDNDADNRRQLKGVVRRNNKAVFGALRELFTEIPAQQSHLLPLLIQLSFFGQATVEVVTDEVENDLGQIQELLVEQENELTGAAVALVIGLIEKSELPADTKGIILAALNALI